MGAGFSVTTGVCLDLFVTAREWWLVWVKAKVGAKLGVSVKVVVMSAGGNRAMDGEGSSLVLTVKARVDVPSGSGWGTKSAPGTNSGVDYGPGVRVPLGTKTSLLTSAGKSSREGILSLVGVGGNVGQSEGVTASGFLWIWRNIKSDDGTDWPLLWGWSADFSDYSNVPKVTYLSRWRFNGIRLLCPDTGCYLEAGPANLKKTYMMRAWLYFIIRLLLTLWTIFCAMARLRRKESVPITA